MINIHEGYMAGLGLELRTLEFAVRLDYDCATEPVAANYSKMTKTNLHTQLTSAFGFARHSSSGY